MTPAPPPRTARRAPAAVAENRGCGRLASAARHYPAPAPLPLLIRWHKVRILTFTTLYPNAVRPQHGIFVETRLRKLVESGRVEARIVAPCPWFPFSSERFGAYAAMARVPRAETRHGLHIEHPRYPLVPKIGMSTRAPGPLRRVPAAAAPADRLGRRFRPDRRPLFLSRRGRRGAAGTRPRPAGGGDRARQRSQPDRRA